MKNLVIVSLIAVCLSSCGLSELMEKTDKMTSVVKSNCDCDDVRLLRYEDNKLGATTAYFEIVGTAVDQHLNVASKINDSLKLSIDNYCDIDAITLDFINKGNSHKISIKECTLIE